MTTQPKEKIPAPWNDEQDGVLRPRAVLRYARILRLMREAEWRAMACGVNVRPVLKRTTQ